jgi:hypothetical protein
LERLPPPALTPEISELDESILDPPIMLGGEGPWSFQMIFLPFAVGDPRDCWEKGETISKGRSGLSVIGYEPPVEGLSESYSNVFSMLTVTPIPFSTRDALDRWVLIAVVVEGGCWPV